MREEMFQVEEIETINFDENGKEDGTWKGHAVTKIDDPVNYCFECRDKLNADKLCDFMNNECYINIEDVSVEAFVIDNCIEWGNIISDLGKMEKDLYKFKEDYQIKSDELLEEARRIKDETEEDIIKAKYGGNNDKIRAKYVKESLVDDAKKIKDLEFDIEHCKRRISYLKGLVYAKTALINVKPRKKVFK